MSTGISDIVLGISKALSMRPMVKLRILKSYHSKYLLSIWLFMSFVVINVFMNDIRSMVILTKEDVIKKLSSIKTILQLKYNRSVIIGSSGTTYRLMNLYNEYRLRRTEGNGSIILTGIPINRGLNHTIKRQLNKL
ncbi:unnamed protein product [Oppiella nova]|uniref:Uncharacterized protein n=1 Tax=Oppiella nova TaxID=334625 RepID=A0A7R9M412_9ACAR|nr:unnamed protein product [Oppiella nova]CAG2170150.1 unnamed protein product [Oppiella nova]